MGTDVEIPDVLILKESPKAWKCDFAGQETHVPKSCIKGYKREGALLAPLIHYTPMFRVTLVVTEWWWRQWDSGAWAAGATSGPTAAATGTTAGQKWTTKDPSPPPVISANLIAGEKVFKKLALKYHPDRYPGDPEIMTDITELWNTVKGGKK